MSRNYSTTKPGPGAIIDRIHPLTRGLTGLWLFNEGAGGRASDIAGGMHASASGWAVEGAGIASTPFDLRQAPTPFTAHIAIRKIGTLSGAFRNIFRSNINWYIAAGGSSLDVAVWNAAGSVVQPGIGTNLASFGNNSSVTLTFDGAIVSTYFSGLFQGSAALSGPMRSNSTPLWIGETGGGGAALDGAILRMAAIYARALNASEVRTLHASPYSMLSRPVGQRNFAGGSGLLLARRRDAA